MRKRGFASVALLLGLAVPIPVLIATGQLGALVPQGGRHSDRPEDVAAAQQEDARMVVCYGFADLEYGVTGLHPNQPGRVVEVRARENEAVKAGDVLLRLDDRAAKLHVDEARAALDGARARLERAETGQKQHKVKIAQQQAAVDAAGHRLATARHTLRAKERLQEIEAVGRRKEDPIMKEEIAGARERVEEVEAGERAERELLADLKDQDPNIELRQARAEVAAMQAKLDQATQALEEHTLRSPSAGTVLRVLVAPEELLGARASKAAIQFCPEGPRIVRAEVEQAFASRVSVGQAAVVEDDVRSGDAWTGRVARVSDWYVQRRPVADEVLQMKDVRTLECIISFSEPPPLRIGQRVRVTLRRGSP
jgi:multidrug resistance efflux pump